MLHKLCILFLLPPPLLPPPSSYVLKWCNRQESNTYLGRIIKYFKLTTPYFRFTQHNFLSHDIWTFQTLHIKNKNRKKHNIVWFAHNNDIMPTDETFPKQRVTAIVIVSRPTLTRTNVRIRMFLLFWIYHVSG